MGRLWTLNSSLRLWAMPWMTNDEESFPSKIFSFLAVQIFHTANATWARVFFLFGESFVESNSWVHHSQKREVTELQSVRTIPANLHTSMECGGMKWSNDTQILIHLGTRGIYHQQLRIFLSNVVSPEHHYASISRITPLVLEVF